MMEFLAFISAMAALVGFISLWRIGMSHWIASRMRKADELDQIDRAWLGSHEKKCGRAAKS